MITFDPESLPKVLELYLELSQYPILATAIRAQIKRPDKSQRSSPCAPPAPNQRRHRKHRPP